MLATSLRRVLPIDAALALVVGGLTTASTHWAWWDDPSRRTEMQLRHGGPPFRPVGTEFVATAWSLPWLVNLSIAAVVAGLILRRIFPRSAYVLVVVATGAFLAAGGPYGPVLLAPALAVLGLATALPLRSWVPWLAGLPVMMSAGFWRQPAAGLLDPAIWPAALFGSAAVILPALFLVLRRARREADARDREVERDRYVYAERMRIAREVHDVVGHSLSVIHLQAGVALHVLDKRPAQVAASLEAIRVTSKDALAELRHTLGMFRDAADRESTNPPAGLAQLDDLVAPLRTAGRTVDVRISGEILGQVPAVVDHAVYRIVQEALTNVVRHAGAASVVVELTLVDGQLRILVTDDGAPDSGAAGRSAAGREIQPGHGIRGMQERATAVGGWLVVRPGDTHGTIVEAVLPITSEAAPQ